MANPQRHTATARLTADRIRDLGHGKTRAEIAGGAGVPDARMATFRTKVRNDAPRDRLPLPTMAMVVDPASVMRPALDRAVGETAEKAEKAEKAVTDIHLTPATGNELGRPLRASWRSRHADLPATARVRCDRPDAERTNGVCAVFRATWPRPHGTSLRVVLACRPEGDTLVRAQHLLGIGPRSF